MIEPFTDEQIECIDRLQELYGAWIEDGRIRRSIAADPSIEPAVLNDVDARLAESRPRVLQASRLYRDLKLPRFPYEVTAVLREADRRDLLGSRLVIVGPEAMAAYALEAGGRIVGDPTDRGDVRMAWTARDAPVDAVWDICTMMDPGCRVEGARPSRVRFSQGGATEIVAAPSRSEGFRPTDRIRPTILPDQEWLLSGRHVDHVVSDEAGQPVRIVAPDPRRFALHRMWLGSRNQIHLASDDGNLDLGSALLSAVAEAMPRYPFDDAFEGTLPDELRALLNRSVPTQPAVAWSMSPTSAG
ncbi:GSU2403 family nucleotidyltransferase fold protein [Methylobacterium haplocladii]|uniref:Nucleotidyltransferase-like domain-containing protein n=1 Tax=Methylobacterium haplocladii TaxID=1176176 RepID=A0A512IN45_9HYPH|nr:GSU2403 family nucleotidyltransferase fold protein [Methylobacterium haplocladii]GEO99123.1 hypothetical protein MHA02_15110 [Methylobacterium haplocladii]GJD84784.1 hypothetical protein HPGCJGGD_2667 [Methylobacterium haplocladii]GLS58360.1 hypothetical protein GCM10007887_10200 [Methylobacterium haplocladii]